MARITQQKLLCFISIVFLSKKYERVFWCLAKTCFENDNDNEAIMIIITTEMIKITIVVIIVILIMTFIVTIDSRNDNNKKW